MQLCEPPASALSRWSPEIQAASGSEDSNTINVYSTIGDYGDGQGTTARLVGSILRRAGGDPVTLNINSPGGDFFEGLAIHSLLTQYEGDVHVKVVGLAASAASVIALAGDTINIAESGFLMIHNAWTLAMGNQHDMLDVAEMLSKFDTSMASLYASATGISEKRIHKMMDAETWISGKEAVDMGFASGLLGSSDLAITEGEKTVASASVRRVDVAMAKAGIPRSERRRLIKEISTSTPSATEPTTLRATEPTTLRAGEPATPSAGDVDLSTSLVSLLATLNQTNNGDYNDRQ